MRPSRPAALAVAAALTVVGCGTATTHDSSSQSAAAHVEVLAQKTAPKTPAVTPREERETVATVGKVKITRRRLRHWIALAAHNREGGVPEPPQYTGCIQSLRTAGDERSTNEQLRNACHERYAQDLETALGSLIHYHWLIGTAAEEGVEINRAQLAHESSLSGPHSEAVKQTLASTGETIDDLRLNVTVGQLTSRLYRKLERRIPRITSASISKYYTLHKDSFNAPEERDLYVVRLGTVAAANAAMRKLEHGASFGTIIESTSLGQPETPKPNDPHPGLIHGLKPNDWPERPLSRAIFHAPLNKLTGPVPTSLRYYIFKVVGKTPPRQTTLAEVRPEVVRELRLALHDQTISRYVSAFRKRWIARTSCRPGYVVKYCRQYKSASRATQGSATEL